MQPAAPYRERLTVRLRWWVQATMALVALWLAFVVALPELVAWAVAGTVGLVVYGGLARWGSAVVEVRDGWFLAHRARIEAQHLGVAEALDAEATRHALGRGADARAHLVTRPWLSGAVRVHLQDPADPTPYWLVSSRRPEALAAAVNELAASGRRSRADGMAEPPGGNTPRS